MICRHAEIDVLVPQENHIPGVPKALTFKWTYELDDASFPLCHAIVDPKLREPNPPARCQNLSGSVKAI